MERFFNSQITLLIERINSGDAELIEQQLGVCKGWGGGPLAAAALVAEAWLAERGAVTRRAKPSGGTGSGGKARRNPQLRDAVPPRAKPSSSKGSGGNSRHNPEQWNEAPSSLPPIC